MEIHSAPAAATAAAPAAAPVDDGLDCAEIDEIARLPRKGDENNEGAYTARFTISEVYGYKHLPLIPAPALASGEKPRNPDGRTCHSSSSSLPYPG